MDDETIWPRITATEEAQTSQPYALPTDPTRPKSELPLGGTQT